MLCLARIKSVCRANIPEQGPSSADSLENSFSLKVKAQSKEHHCFRVCDDHAML